MVKIQSILAESGFWVLGGSDNDKTARPRALGRDWSGDVGATLVVARGAGRHKTGPYDEAPQGLSI